MREEEGGGRWEVGGGRREEGGGRREEGGGRREEGGMLVKYFSTWSPTYMYVHTGM